MSTTRPAISRRSCDQCRARKIGCDRGTPCSNCVSARVECTHSTIVPKSTSSRQRVLISSQYERKIDNIARDVEDIKSLLRGLHSTATSTPPGLTSTPIKDVHHDSRGAATQTLLNPDSQSQWDHSVHILDFLKAVLANPSFNHADPESAKVISSLGHLISTLDNSTPTYLRPISHRRFNKDQLRSQLIPVDQVVEILRWTRAHQAYARVTWICRILPLENFEEICRKVYFAVGEYSDIDFVIAHSFLSYMFAEHTAIYGTDISRTNCELCRRILGESLPRLPQLLPASMEVIAALTLGCLYMIENAQAMAAWTFISSALSLCQTLGYHHLKSADLSEGSVHSAQLRLFWTVFSFENGLSLRLSRSSNIRDADITSPNEPNEPRFVKVAKIQRQVYDQLYSASALNRGSYDRITIAQTLSRELGELIDEARVDITEATSKLKDPDSDFMRIVYLQCDIVCESSLLAFILQTIPSQGGSIISPDCITVARNTMDLHDECMRCVHQCKDPSLITKYIAWSVMHTPFVPFSILFTHAVQTSDIDDLTRLDRFAASLTPPRLENNSLTHPSQLYKLLSQAGHLYVKASSGVLNMQTKSFASHIHPAFVTSGPGQTESVASGLEYSGNHDPLVSELADWHHVNQQLISLLDNYDLNL